ncbi:2-oxo-4-hydroxy-4-carboxy-5-ureidoimidazoline decarboxylase [Streptomyces xinghaiensis]|uniref:2-oxo-4-hydroxy-4-carboxy-5-ureidoimidazoline decarboxylase n=1 Tax=Streptomyces xinghaiensis TaxID=1038928 RepID=UPI000BAF6851|nr:2-oxo-4-hydroxy-4-carboxy-5-ureidoimidazoline decarboxylase [Streptomyces xinghaiensis]
MRAPRHLSHLTSPGPARGLPEESTVFGLDHFNAQPPDTAEHALLACCGSRRWARSLAGHRPYPDVAALLAAADEASYDLSPADLAEALARESAPGLPGLPLPGLPLPRARSGEERQPALAGPRDSCRGSGQPDAVPPRRPGVLAAHTALRAAHAAYESRFGHAFVICLDGVDPAESLDHVLAGLRTRLGHEPEKERAVVAEELRRLSRGRLARLMA